MDLQSLKYMNPSSRGSSRSNISKQQQSQQNMQQSYIDPTTSPFNQSFYQQKQSQSYNSYQYIKRYLNESNLSFTIQKMMGIVLKMQKLPQNPYNLMYRLIHHEAIYQNLRRFYNQDREFENMIHYHAEEDEEQIDNDPNDHIDFRKIRLKDKDVLISGKLVKYLNFINAFVFSKIIDSRRISERHKIAIQKHNFKDIYLSYGGPIVLNLKGNRGIIDVPAKLPKQQSEKSIYCGDAMLTITVYINTSRQITKSFQQFSQFIIQDLKESIQYKDQNYTIYLQKLELFNIDELFNIFQFSREQIINQSGTVNKQIMKNIEKENLVIRAKCVYRLSKDLTNAIGEQFITVSKQYVLIAKVQDTLTILSNQPLKYAMKEIFLHQECMLIILEHQQYRNKNLFEEFKIEMMHTLGNNLKNQNLAQLTWDLFYCLLYENVDHENTEFLQDLNRIISYILLSPISFVYRLIYTLRCVKWLSSPSFPSLSEDEAYKLIITAENDITAFIHRGNYIYWQLQIFYQAIKRMLSIIVQFKQLKISSIVFIVDHALLMLNGVTVNFTHILLVLQGNIMNYINIIRSPSSQEKNDNHSDNIVSYETFIKNKELPMRVLKMQQEIKKAKKQLNLSENQVKSIIMAKYINKYKFYDKIYSFYWELFIGKKPTYPLSKFLKFLMVNSTQCNYQLFKQNYAKPKFKIDVNPINQINVYEINNPENSYVFYSLNPNALNIYTLKQYKIILELIKPFFQQQGNDNGLGFRYGSRTTIQTNQFGSSSDTKKKNTVTIGIKSIQIGDNMSEEVNSFNQSKLLVDVILYRTFNNKYDLYSHVLEYLYEAMDKMDKENYSVLGLYPYYENHYNILSNEDFVYSKILNDESIIRYDYKKKVSLERFMKFVDATITQGKFIEIKVIYTVREIVKVVKLSMNFYYRTTSQNQYISIFKPNFIFQRIYSSKKELMIWGEVSNYRSLRQFIPSSMKKNSKENMLLSLKKLHDEKQVSIIDLISEKEMDNANKEQTTRMRQQFNKQKYYKQSIFYNLFQRALEMIQNMHILIDYLKTDRRGRYQLSHLRKIYQLLKYYLIDRCLIKDDFIYSQGAAVSIINLMTYIQEYLDRHPDNNGEERELLYLERVISRLGNLVKFQEISCSICIYQSIILKQQQLTPTNNP